MENSTLPKLRPDADDEADAIKVAAAGVQAFQEAVVPMMPESIRRICEFVAAHVCRDEQTRNNTANALMILAGLNGYTATIHND